MSRIALLRFCLIIFTQLLFGENLYCQYELAFSIRDSTLVPEGIAYDPISMQFFLSSVNKEKVVAISSNGDISDFVMSSKDSLFQTLGMKVDLNKRRLWVLSNKEVNNWYYSAIHIYDIESKRLVKRFLFKNIQKHLFNDLVLDSKGNAYITDYYKNSIFLVSSNLVNFKLFIESDSLLRMANGIAIHPNNKILYVATRNHIAIVDLISKRIYPILNPKEIDNYGIDGIVYTDNSLFAIVNGRLDEKEIHIAKYCLSSNNIEINGIKILDKGNKYFSTPTTCVVVGNYIYCLVNTSLATFLLRDLSSIKFNKPLIFKYKIK